MAATLVGFGIVMGCTSVAMNLPAVLVERNEGRALMSGYHAMFSLGGMVGSGVMALLLAGSTKPFVVASIISVVTAVLLIVARSGLLPYSDEGGAKPAAFVIPQGIVLVIGCLSLLAMLAEGAILDWGALFMIEAHNAEVGLAGLASSAFAITMTLGRLLGDGFRTVFGDLLMLVLSAAMAGFLVNLLLPSAIAALLGFQPADSCRQPSACSAPQW
jgi:hypothetical protein